MVRAKLTGLHARYLSVLDVEQGPPDLPRLRAIVAAHLYRVPFENVSKLLLFSREGAGRPIALEEFLDGIQQQDLGGTCYTSNPFLCELLRALGYDAQLFGADMSAPDVHTSIRVSLDDVHYHVDVGYGAPFRSPIALSGLPHIIANGAERFEFEAAGDGACRLSMFVGGELRHGYLAHPPGRAPEFFRQTILDSYEPGRTFMRCLRISRQFEDRSVDLRNRRVIVSRPESSEAFELGSLAELRRAMETLFLMPRCPVEPAVAVLERLTGRAFFAAEGWADSID